MEEQTLQASLYFELFHLIIGLRPSLAGILLVEKILSQDCKLPAYQCPFSISLLSNDGGFCHRVP